MNRDDIFKQLEEHREQIRGFGVKNLGLFGSVARGETSAGSDLDFVVEFDQKSFDAYMDLKLFLEDLFNCRVDLVIKESIKPGLRSRILKEAVYAPEL